MSKRITAVLLTAFLLISIPAFSLAADSGPAEIAEAEAIEAPAELIESSAEPLAADGVAEIAEVSGDYEYQLNRNGAAVITKYTGTEANVIIPATLNGKSVLRLEDNSFSYRSDIVSVIIPEGVREIGAAFSNCRRLQSVTLPSTLTAIEDDAFFYSDLRSITIPASVTSIGESAFQYCTAMTTATISARITRLRSLTFGDCVSLRSVTLPSTLTEIDAAAFINCVALTGISLPAGVTTVGYRAFDGCNLGSVVIPKSLTKISNAAFVNSGITSLTLPDTLSSIEHEAFSKCKISTLTIPHSVTYIGARAFADCGSLKKANIGIGVKNLDTGVFSGCSSLENIILPEGMLSIDEMAFKGCNLKTITIPRSVNNIAKSAFTGNSSLIVIGYVGSYAEQYAKQYKYGFHDITKPFPVNVTKVTLSKTTAAVKKGATLTLTATVSPTNATYKTVKWKSSDTKIATVSGGKVKGTKPGKVTITATASNGKTAKCVVTVK